MTIDPVTAWVILLRNTPAITAIVPADHIAYEVEDVSLPLSSNWIVVSSVGIEWAPGGFWEGTIQLMCIAPHGHLSQAIQMAIVDSIGDPMLGFKIHRVDSGSQEGAVIGAGEMFALSRGRIPVTGGIELPFRSISILTKVSIQEMSWT